MTTRRLRSLLIYLLSMGLVFAAALTYFARLRISIVVALIFAFIPYLSIQHYLGQKAQQACRSTAVLYLQHLLSGLTGGKSLEKMVRQAGAQFCPAALQSADFRQWLTYLSRDLDAQMPLSQALSAHQAVLVSQDVRTAISMLAKSVQLGARAQDFMESAIKMLNEQDRLAEEVAAENARDRLEATVLNYLPLALAIILRRMWGQTTQISDPSSRQFWLTLLSFCFLLLSWLLSTFVKIKKEPAYKPRDQARATISSGFIMQRLAVSRPAWHPLIDRLGSLYPAARRLKLYQAFSLSQLAVAASPKAMPADLSAQARSGLADSHNPSGQLPDYLQFIRRLTAAKLDALLIGSLGGLLVGLFWFPGLYLFPIFSLMIAFTRDQQILERAKETELQLLHDLPYFLVIGSRLLEAGMSMTQAIKFSSEQLVPERPLYWVISRILVRISSGLPAGPELAVLAARLATPTAQSALMLLEQYERMGQPHILSRLSEQASRCWELLSYGMRKRAEQRAALLLIPMMLDLLSVILLAMAPSLELLSQGLLF
ncbi:hypothetical protein HCH52_03150 [Oscillospiraceae bacterium HV4-5-C5C]|nr:hypothetical protein [Oscillospiraceae bacterium HV4-5-C5C]